MSAIAASSALAAVAFGTPAMAQTETFYEGERISLLVPFGPGGGTDVWARFMTEYMTKHIEGSPPVIIDNRPGGGSVTGVNYYAANVEADGYTVLATSGSSIQPYLLGHDLVRYNLADLRPLAANPVGAIFYVNPSSGIDSIEELLETEEELLYGGISASGNDLVMLLIFDLLDIDVRSVWGFDGKGSIRIAYERGEVNTDYQVTPAYLTSVQPLVDAGEAVPLFTFGIIGPDGEVIRDPAFPDLPTVAEVYETQNGAAPSGLEWEAYKTFLAAGFAVQKILWVKQDTPPEAISALEEGLAAISKDPDFLEKGGDIIGGYPLLVGDEAVAAVRSITSASDEIIKYGQEFLAERGLQ